LYKYESCFKQKHKLENLQQGSLQLLGTFKVEEHSTTKITYKEHVCHEVKYDPSDKDSDLYKKYMKPFSYGAAQQWLEFMDDLNMVIPGNGLDNNGPAHFNLTRSSLKGEALCVFNDKLQNKKKK
jgi:hypothetical protein